MASSTLAPVEQLPDRPYDTRRNLRFLGFLLRQPWMAVPALVVGAAWCALLVAGGGVTPGRLALAPVMGFGAAMLLGGGGFMLVRLVRPAEARPVPGPDERTLFEHAAIHWTGSESREGTLLVTSRGWTFVPGRFSITRGVVHEPHADVRAISWFRSPAPGGVSTSTVVLTTPRGTTELLFHGLDLASEAAERASPAHG